MKPSAQRTAQYTLVGVGVGLVAGMLCATALALYHGLALWRTLPVLWLFVGGSAAHACCVGYLSRNVMDEGSERERDDAEAQAAVEASLWPVAPLCWAAAGFCVTAGTLGALYGPAGLTALFALLPVLVLFALGAGTYRVDRDRVQYACGFGHFAIEWDRVRRVQTDAERSGFVLESGSEQLPVLLLFCSARRRRALAWRLEALARARDLPVEIRDDLHLPMPRGVWRRYWGGLRSIP